MKIEDHEFNHEMLNYNKLFEIFVLMLIFLIFRAWRCYHCYRTSYWMHTLLIGMRRWIFLTKGLLCKWTARGVFIIFMLSKILTTPKNWIFCLNEILCVIWLHLSIITVLENKTNFKNIFFLIHFKILKKMSNFITFIFEFFIFFTINYYIQKEQIVLIHASMSEN